jgi:Epoxide hydrolase N terminus
VQLAAIQALVTYWGTGYDWRGCEAKLNALPQCVTEIDGLGIHFIHVKSRHADALPLIITHGWPGCSPSGCAAAPPAQSSTRNCPGPARLRPVSLHPLRAGRRHGGGLRRLGTIA